MPAEVQRTPWREELTATPAKSEEEHENAERQRQLYDKLLQEKGIAKYKLEVTFNNERSMHRPFGGTVTWWESGAKLHGGGDSKLYVCDNNSSFPQYEGRGCNAFLPDSANGLNFIVCPACGTMWRNEEVVGEVWYRLTIQKWADVLLRWFSRLDHNADIRLKYAREDIRTAAMIEQARDKGGEILQRVRDPKRRASSIYPLASIIKDTSAGADLRGRILAYLQA